MQLGKVGRCVSSKCVHKCIVDIRYSYLSAVFLVFTVCVIFWHGLVLSSTLLTFSLEH